MTNSSSRCLFFPQSLLVLTNYHFLCALWKTPLKIDIRHTRRFSHQLISHLFAFLQKIGYVSDRFSETIVSSIRIFLDSTTFSLFPSDLPHLSSISVHFGASPRSISLTVRSSLKLPDPDTYAPLVSRLNLNVSSLSHFDFLHNASPFFFSNVKLLDVLVTPCYSFPSFCQSLMANSTVEDLSIEFLGISESNITDLADVFSSKNTFRKITILNRGPAPSDDAFKYLFVGLSRINLLQVLDISGFSIRNSTTLLPLCHSTSLKSISFPRVSHFDSVLFAALGNNSSIRRIVFHDTNFKGEDLVNLLNLNRFLKVLNIRETTISLSPIFKSLLTNNSLVELILHNANQAFNVQDAKSLCELLQLNSTLLVLNLHGSLINSLHFKNILDAIQLNSRLRAVSFPHLNLSCLTLLYEYNYSTTRKLKIDISPHSIDFDASLICYDDDVSDCDLLALLNALESNVLIKRVDCLGSSEPSLAGLIALFKILSINKSVIDVDFSPHLIDLENGSFCCLPRNSPQVTAEQVSSLKCFLEYFNIKKLTLKGCRFNDDAITSLVDLIRLNTSLTSIDFSDCHLLDHHILELTSPLQRHHSLTSLKLCNNDFGLSGLVSLFTLVSPLVDPLAELDHVPLTVDVSPHSLDCSNGYIRCVNAVGDDGLTSLLNVVKLGHCITRVECFGFDCLSVKDLVVLFEILSINQSIIDCHQIGNQIDLLTGVINCQQYITIDDLLAILKALKSRIPINLVEYRGMKSVGIPELVALFQILSISKSVISVDISPHCIDLDNSVFCYSPKTPTQVSAKDLSHLLSLLECVSIRELALVRCRFSDDAIMILSDIIEINQLTSVDFSYCRLSDSNISTIFRRLGSNHCSKLELVDLRNNYITDDGALKLSLALETNVTITEMNLSWNLFDPETKPFLNSNSNGRILC
ncbi:hypothetical protein GEMRC1_000725 [Eukaryota sp. GEM-RC1]